MFREIDFRYIVVRNGADYGEIYPIEGNEPTIRMSDSALIKTSLSGSFADPGDSIDWITDQIRAELILDGVHHPLGVYLPASVTLVENEIANRIRLEAYDRCWLLRDTRTENLLHISAGTNYLAAVQQLLTGAGIALVSAVPTSLTISEDREDWTVGTSYLDIINELLGEINYKPVWFSADGLAILEPAAVPTAENIQHTLDENDVKSLLLPAMTRATDIYRSPNVFICVCSNPDKSGPMIARAENTNPQSPLSISRRGRRIVHVENVNNIADQTELQAYADRLRNESMLTGETIAVQTGLLPGYGVADVVALACNGVFAVCVEHDWTMQLRVGGTMQHTLEKVVVNLG